MNARPYNRAEKGLNPKNIKLKKKSFPVVLMGLKGGKNVTGMCSIHYLYPKVHLKKLFIYLFG